MKKNNFKSLAAVLSLAMAATAVPVNANAAAAPKITVNKKTVYSGKTASVTVNNLKKGYTVQFSSTEGGVNFKQKKVKATGKKVTTKFTVKAAKSIADNTKTKIKAVVKNASGKKVKTVNQTVTLKQLAKSLTMKDLENTTVQVGAEVNADATISPKAAKGAYKKTFTSSDSSVLQVVNSGNGLFKAVAPGTATISVTAVNDKNKVVEGSKTLSVTVVEADEDTNKPGEDTNKPGDDNQVTVPTGPAITTDYQLTLTPGKTSINANSIDTTDIEVLLKAPTDATINKDMAVAVQLVLGTRGVGSLSQEDITILWNEEKQGWYGVVKFTSATLTTSATSTLTASITSVINGPEGKDLRGIAANEIKLDLVPTTPTVGESEAVQAISAVVENLDRITITFNKPVTRDMFLSDDTNKKVANGLYQQNVTGKDTNPLYFEMYIKDKVNETDNVYPSVPYKANSDRPNIVDGEPQVNNSYNGRPNEKIDITQEDVADILAVSGNDRALTFVLANDRTPASTKHKNKVFTDNSKFLVTFIDRHTKQTATGQCANYITDTTTPNVMTVKQNDMKSIIITFDQPVYSAADWALANRNNNHSTAENIDVINKDLAKISALNPANYAIDGMRLDRTHVRTTVNGRTYFGDPENTKCADKNAGKLTENGVNQGLIKIELTDPIARNEVKITLGKDVDCGDGDKIKQCYFDQGTHVVQIFNVGDYAALTETGTNNCITTKNFDFTISADNKDPNFTVKALSPEQYRITFNTQIAELEGIAVGEQFDLGNVLNMQFRFKDTTVDPVGSDPAERQLVPMADFNVATNPSAVNNGTHSANGQRTGLGQEIRAVRIADTEDGNHQIKVEVGKDWTQLNNYKVNRKTYYNYELQFFLPAGKWITNVTNGHRKDNIAKNITEDIIKSPDVKTPEMTNIEAIEEAKVYKVNFSEPVQATNRTLADPTNNYYAHAYTPAFRPEIGGDATIGTMTAEFYNKDTKRSYSAEITGWADLEDQSVYIRPEKNVITELPAGNYTLIVRGVSDDVGNTSNTLTGDFTVGSTASDFKVLSILADSKVDITGIQHLNKVVTGSQDGQDAIYIEFSKMYRAAPIADSVLNTQNWTINGSTLPVGSTIANGVRNGNDTIIEGVTIYLPDGTLTNTDATLVKIGANVKAENGDAITGRTTFTTQSIFKGSRLENKGYIDSYGVLDTDGLSYINGNEDISSLENIN